MSWWLLPIAYLLGSRAGRRGGPQESPGPGIQRIAGWLIVGILAAIIPVLILIAWHTVTFLAAVAVSWLAVDALVVTAGIRSSRP